MFTNIDFVNHFLDKDITSFRMDMVPRITRAQSMDILSSIENNLFFHEKTRMLFGNAKDNLQKIISEVKNM